MRIPLVWLREFVDVRVEPRRLAEDLTLAGLPVDAVEGTGDGVVFDLDITTNRVDCMNVYGVAREVSVLYDLPLKPLETAFEERGTPSGEELAVEVLAPDLCPRFCARVLDVKLGSSPSWMTDRLEMVGVRPINNVVDLSNYVMMEMGHPTHAFDLARIPDARIQVRWAEQGERLVTLDDVERELHPGVGVVASPPAGLALAGIMGGASSEVSDDTTTVALEAAYWTPLVVRRAARSLGMHTEASHRFERGADPEATAVSIARLAHLLERIGAGHARPGLIDVRPVPRQQRRAPLRVSRASALLGVEVPEADAARILTGLGFEAAGELDGRPHWEVPTWRSDVTREADLIEEVGRHFGFDRIASTLPAAREVGGLRPDQVAARRLRERLVGVGLYESIGHSLVSDDAAGEAVPARVALENPLSEDQDVLRSSLVVPGLLAALGRNERQGRRDVGLFEVGRVFLPGDGAPSERTRLGLVLAGARRSAHWSGRSGDVDFFDAKGLVGLALEGLGVGEWSLTRDGVPPFLHPGQSASVLVGGESIGYLGTLHPDFARQRDVRPGAVVAELSLDRLLERPPEIVRFSSLPRFPEVARDLSILCSAERAAQELAAIVRDAAGELLLAVEFADRYTGAPVPEDQVSLMLTLHFRHAERTLTGEEVQSAVDAVVVALREAGAEIRGGE